MLAAPANPNPLLRYICYGLSGSAASAFLVWLGPAASLISNASIIAQKSMATKLVQPSEKGEDRGGL